MSEKRVKYVLRVTIEGPAPKVHETAVLLENHRVADWDVDFEVERVEGGEDDEDA